MTPLRGNTFLFRSSQQLPRLRLGAFRAETAPFSARGSPRALLQELQNDTRTPSCVPREVRSPQVSVKNN